MRNSDFLGWKLTLTQGGICDGSEDFSYLGGSILDVFSCEPVYICSFFHFQDLDVLLDDAVCFRMTHTNI